MWERVVEGVGEQRKKSCGVAEKQKKAEYCKQYRMKRKFLMQKQASTSETELLQKQKKAEYAKQYRLKCKLQMLQQASTFNV
jgi:4-hydroxy-3-methylbut-2-en-1-yl diphosphate synthase IspG/GcpE